MRPASLVRGVLETVPLAFPCGCVRNPELSPPWNYCAEHAALHAGVAAGQEDDDVLSAVAEWLGLEDLFR